VLIVSFFTADWQYPQHASRLAKECADLGLRYRIEQLQTTSSYLRNCCMKPAYIRMCLEEEKGPVMWMDVDGSIFQKPDFFSDDDPFDFQAKRMNSMNRRRAWHVGTMWWNYTDEARSFIDRWVDNTGESTDESSLEYTWRQPHNLRTRDIPKSYFEILRDKRSRPQDVVIGHRLSGSTHKKEEYKLAEIYERTVI
jgi:hypothetical protein